MPTLSEREIRDDLLAAALSHELKTPIAALKSSVENLRDQLREIGAALEQAQNQRAALSEIAPLIDAALADPIAGSPPMGLAMLSRIQEVERGLAGVLPEADARRAAEVIVRGGWCAQAGVLTPILRRHGAASVLPLLDSVGRARSSLRSLELSVRRLDGLGRTLRQTADALRGGGAPAAGSFDLHDCLEAAAEEAAHAVTPGSSFHVACDPGIVAAGPVEPIERVITNLCLNALAAVAPSGGHVTLTGCAREGEAVLAVEDNGPGIADSIRDRLFTPFATTKPHESGGGLGLFVCRRIVESRGGEISFTTGPSGTRFEVRLPLAAPRASVADLRERGGASLDASVSDLRERGGR